MTAKDPNHGNYEYSRVEYSHPDPRNWRLEQELHTCAYCDYHGTE